MLIGRSLMWLAEKLFDMPSKSYGETEGQADIQCTLCKPIATELEQV
jgi:hypothetical protein